MPKTLFYAGVVFSALFALMIATGVVQTGRTPGLDALLYDPAAAEASAPASPAALLAIFVMMIPVASILLRMASLVAARNLFAAFFGIFSVSCAALTAGYLAAMQFRISLLLRASSEAVAGLRPLLESQVVSSWSFGWFMSLAVLALRPYFRIQASRTLSALVFLPTPVFLWSMAGNMGQTPGAPASSSVLLFWSLVAAVLLAISVHCMRHRHLFIEVTNLRELLDTRIVPPRGEGRLSFNGGVAFDS